MKRAWAIKLGSGGICIPFCEGKGIVGVGWKEIDLSIAKSGKKEALKNDLRSTSYYKNNDKAVGIACGNLYRFCYECSVGDYILYYDPSNKRVRIAQVVSEAKRRNFDLSDDTDIWLYREVIYPDAVALGIPIVAFDGSLKGSLLGPRGTFWSMDYKRVSLLALGQKPHFDGASAEDLKSTQEKLWELIMKRASFLNETDWEKLVADYFRGLGAHIGKVGGSQAVQDFEAVFCKGSQLEQKWRVQVKRYQDKKASWKEVSRFIEHVSDDNVSICFVSVYGFESKANEMADSHEIQNIKLLQMEDFFQFILSGKYDPGLAEKMGIMS